MAGTHGSIRICHITLACSLLPMRRRHQRATRLWPPSRLEARYSTGEKQGDITRSRRTVATSLAASLPPDSCPRPGDRTHLSPALAPAL
jgi:hypothetical protein